METQMIQQEFPPARKEELDSASASMPGPPLEAAMWGRGVRPGISFIPIAPLYLVVALPAVTRVTLHYAS